MGERSYRNLVVAGNGEALGPGSGPNSIGNDSVGGLQYPAVAGNAEEFGVGVEAQFRLEFLGGGDEQRLGPAPLFQIEVGV